MSVLTEDEKCIYNSDEHKGVVEKFQKKIVGMQANVLDGSFSHVFGHFFKNMNFPENRRIEMLQDFRTKIINLVC